MINKAKSAFGELLLWLTLIMIIGLQRDTTQSTHILKAEYALINGPLRDVAWDSESKRIAAVGEGRERFGHVILFDTGTSNGNLSGQSRPMSK